MTEPTPEATTGDREATSPHDPEMKQAGQLTSPTWELELFLSGALVFATLKFPGLVQSFFASVEPHLAGTTRSIVLNVSIYATAIAYTLLITFFVHLVGRAQWVALMGLHSVFPRGIRWDELKMGPIARGIYQQGTPSLPTAIARLDNFCSVVFSTGMLFVMLFIYSATLVAVLGGMGWGLARLFSGGQHVIVWTAIVALVFVAIPVTAAAIDKKRGDRLASGSTGRRVLYAALRFSYAINLTRVAGPMMWTVMSNIGRTKAGIALYAGLMAIIVLSAADRLARRGALSVNGYDYYGSSFRHGVATAHYENQRQPTASPRAPMIQSDIVRDPYVRLFIPYAPTRHNPALARLCPGLRPLQSQGLQVGPENYAADSLTVPALQCLAKLHAVALDDRPRPDLVFAFHEHPTTGLRGIVTYIPVDSLPRGRHVITVMPAPPAVIPKDTTAASVWKQPWVIPFWK